MIQLKRMALFLALCVFCTSVVAAPKLLVDVDWLKANLKNPNLVVVDMSDALQYRRFHIPQAIHLDYSLINYTTKQGVSYKVPDDRLFKVLGHFGIRSSDHVVVYDDTGGVNAGRLFWHLEQIGHQKVSLLDGGLVAWVLKGYPVDNRQTHRGKTVYQPAKNSKSRQNQVSLNEMLTLDRNKNRLLDVRTRFEYSGHPKQAQSGHIPGAYWMPWNDSIDMSKGFRIKSRNKLIQYLKKVNLTDKKQPVVVYCQSGRRAAQTYFVLRWLGYRSVKLFDGSILEYATQPGAAFRKGMRP